MTYVERTGVVHELLNKVRNQSGTGWIVQMACDHTFVEDPTVGYAYWSNVVRDAEGAPPTCVRCVARES